jgi:hypothetical protein
MRQPPPPVVPGAIEGRPWIVGQSQDVCGLCAQPSARPVRAVPSLAPGLAGLGRSKQVPPHACILQDNTPGIDATSYTHWGIPRGRNKEPNDAETTTVVCDAGLAYQKRWGWADVDNTAFSAAAMCEIKRWCGGLGWPMGWRRLATWAGLLTCWQRLLAAACLLRWHHRAEASAQPGAHQPEPLSPTSLQRPSCTTTTAPSPTTATCSTPSPRRSTRRRASALARLAATWWRTTAWRSSWRWGLGAAAAQLGGWELRPASAPAKAAPGRLLWPVPEPGIKPWRCWLVLAAGGGLLHQERLPAAQLPRQLLDRPDHPKVRRQAQLVLVGRLSEQPCRASAARDVRSGQRGCCQLALHATHPTPFPVWEKICGYPAPAVACAPPCLPLSPPSPHAPACPTTYNRTDPDIDNPVDELPYKHWGMYHPLNSRDSNGQAPAQECGIASGSEAFKGAWGWADVRCGSKYIYMCRKIRACRCPAGVPAWLAVPGAGGRWQRGLPGQLRPPRRLHNHMQAMRPPPAWRCHLLQPPPTIPRPSQPNHHLTHRHMRTRATCTPTHTHTHMLQPWTPP